MAKKVKAIVTLALNAGKASPAPPVGPALAQHGINLMAFCKEYNARTSNRMGDIIPAEITIYTDGSFKFNLKSPPTSFLIKKAAGIDKGSDKAQANKVGSISRKQLAEIAEIKRADTTSLDLEGVMRQIEGTARQMGVVIKE